MSETPQQYRLVSWGSVAARQLKPGDIVNKGRRVQDVTPSKARTHVRVTYSDGAIRNLKLDTKVGIFAEVPKR